MARRKLFGGVALSGLALSSVGTVAASIALAKAPAAGLTRLSLNENPFDPSPRAVEAIQNALTEIARYAGDDAHSLEQQIADREGGRPIRSSSGKSSILWAFSSRSTAALAVSSSIPSQVIRRSWMPWRQAVVWSSAFRSTPISKTICPPLQHG
jgi:histidinol-phosphate/aromatic aminotransferase/cobyric acid decarboxylase-like protein